MASDSHPLHTNMKVRSRFESQGPMMHFTLLPSHLSLFSRRNIRIAQTRQVEIKEQEQEQEE